ncbi:MAG: AMP-binding protein [Deltaproteobacteria bacterium]|jgi:acyl-CoA synthetase (AMP-forming)/AMP-acid ligase II|nr:AMP-binding protein [Deltaproteobacteria bacterium]MBT4644207.1 AMP-binding protein [Deltaproteobacteria bacterium]MBT6500471.1 AMP-binding protein [Deltaproteobacteria bacterium]MBT7154722.1 AMP-binding protein [Deltaproteobacteria bacterium]MBT7716666.1 AMP-binding protein [Deltaproteobacteria bacterium]
MGSWLNLGQVLTANSVKFSKNIAIKDKTRELTYRELNARVNKLAHQFYGLGLKKGDKVAVFLENCIEIVEVFLATAKTGIIIVPINFRLVGVEIEYIVENSDAKALIVHDEFAEKVTSIKPNLTNISPSHFISVNMNPNAGGEIEGYQEYEKFIAAAPTSEPEATVRPEDTWILIYTSGTTGKPKGVIRTHESHIAFYLINAVEYGFNEQDVCLNVMPLCHINSVFFSLLFLYIGGTVYVHFAQSFKPEEILQIIEREKITFISLIPTHYNLILSLPQDYRKPDVSSIKKLLCSSAPARKSIKRAVMDFFPGVELYEAYGSTEGGGVTILKPRDQIQKLGSIGCECLGTDCIKILDMNRKEVAVGEVGELFSRGPMLFSEYYKLPEKTAESFCDGWFSAGDMVKCDEDGYYTIVDRKDNMIITGGENVYPSEIEEVVSMHPAVFDVAVIAAPDEKWGEKVVAVVVPKDDAKSSLTGVEIQNFCKDKLAGFKRPKEVVLIERDEMPRTATGKILHRILRENL